MRAANMGTDTLDDHLGHLPLALPNGISQMGYVAESRRAILGSTGFSEVGLPSSVKNITSVAVFGVGVTLPLPLDGASHSSKTDRSSEI